MPDHLFPFYCPIVESETKFGDGEAAVVVSAALTRLSLTTDELTLTSRRHLRISFCCRRRLS